MAGTTRLSWPVRIKRVYGFSFQKLRFFQRKVLRTLLTGRSNYKARLCLAEFSPLYSTTFDKKISPTSGLYFLLMAGTTRLELATSCVTGMRSNQLSYAPIKYWISKELHLQHNIFYPFANKLILPRILNLRHYAYNINTLLLKSLLYLPVNGG